MVLLTVLHPLRVSLPQSSSRHLCSGLTGSRPLVGLLALGTSARRSFSNYLITPTELADALKKAPPSPISSEPRVIPLCASWFMPNDPQGRTGIQAFREKRIPKARFFDLDKVIDKRSPYPHMLPNSKTFAAAMSELGIRREDIVVLYDTHELGIFSAPRAGWTMNVFGHPRVHVLNNFRLWVEQGLPTESGNVWTVECGTYPIPEMDESKVAQYEEVREVALDYNKEGAEGVQIVDARSHARWTGEAPEPREGLSSGHMPGSINIPFDAVLDPETKAFLPADQLKEVFRKSGLDPEKPIIASCGTGVTACVLETALNVAQYGSPEKIKVYDGSWTEWAQRVKPSDSLIRKQE
ncbi:Rhodanese-like domain-containing protein [Apodospora peruviana]|uniref:Rhodanese-like domain-containing protein n=1 Tax=Apodospora peruviana TaxID=516989 RepID=A0AAE0IBG6_9PEZI|nr:Rhodanese-like domain-containing protein [Apodospora peruviana]